MLVGRAGRAGLYHRAPGVGLVWGLLVLAALARPAGAGGLAELGVLERQAVDDALAARGLTVDPAPAGKRIGEIHVVNQEVFSARDSYAQLLNYFHRTTRERIIRREVLLQPGDLYVEALAEESVRNLRDADFSSLVVIVPVMATAAGTVDLLVVTRDVWSLRFNTDFDYGEGTLRSLSTSLSENNLFGWRKKFSFAFNLGRGAYSLGPSYLDPNIAGTRLTFSASFRAIYNRATGLREGESVGATVSYPLFSLASRWGASLSASHSNSIARSYVGNQLRLVDLAATPAPEALPQIYRVKSEGVSSALTRSFGHDVIQRLSVGHNLSVVRPSFLPDFPSDDPEVRAAFAAAIFPRSERISSVYLAYSVFTPRYRVYRDFSTYDLREDAGLGPSASASVSRAAGFLGSDYAYTGLAASAAWTCDYADGFQQVTASWSARVRDGHLVDQIRSASITLATPVLRRAVRLVGETGVGVIVDSTRPDVYYTAGAETGLRGYGTGEFFGQARFTAHLEARSAPLAVAAFRLGGVAFYDAGHAAASLAKLRVRNDVGLGVRLLIPQLNFYVLRIDWAIPLQNGARAQTGDLLTNQGFPGRISAGFKQVF